MKRASLILGDSRRDFRASSWTLWQEVKVDQALAIVFSQNIKWALFCRLLINIIYFNLRQHPS